VRTAERDDTPTAEVACGGRALCGWSPPSLPADSDLKRRVDRIRLGNMAAVTEEEFAQQKALILGG
jgi:hypothetical protein